MFSNETALSEQIERFIRSLLKNRILAQSQGGNEFQSEDILKYFEELKRGPNTEIGTKDIFEMASTNNHTGPWNKKTMKEGKKTMEMRPQISEKDLEKMPILKRSALLFNFKNKISADNLDDGYHNLKRNTGLTWFDKMLEDCQNGTCPKYISEDIVYILSDMSLEGYVLQKAYHFFKAKVGIDDEERYFKALGNINCVMNCKQETQLDIKVLNQDSKQVYYKTKRQATVYQSARLRKAYWAYLKGAPNNNQINDYFSTCEYIDKIHRIYNKKAWTSDDCERYKEILSENSHIANPLDLFRLCIIRKKQS